MKPRNPTQFDKTLEKKRSERACHMMSPFRPVEASTGKACSGGIDLNPELLQPLRSSLGHSVFLTARRNPQAQPPRCLVKFDTDSTGKVHVAAASKPEHLCFRRFTMERCGNGGNNGQGFDQRGDFWTGKAVIAMFSLRLDDEQFP